MAAVSVRNTRRPNEIGNAPDEVTEATSSGVKSPSGPTQIEIERGIRPNLA